MTYISLMSELTGYFSRTKMKFLLEHAVVLVLDYIYGPEHTNAA